jgi:integrase
MLRETPNLKHRAILATIYGLGLRKSELSGLLPGDVETERGQVRIQMAKGNKDRVMRLQPSLAKLLVSYRAAYQPQYWLFEGQTNGPYSAASVQAIFVAAKARSKLLPQLDRPRFAAQLCYVPGCARYAPARGEGTAGPRAHSDDPDLPSCVQPALWGFVGAVG